MISRYFFIVFLFVLISFSASAQSSAREAQSRLNKIYQEMAELESALKMAEEQKQSELSVLTKIEKQATLLRSALRLLSSEISKTDNEISNLQRQQRSLSGQVGQLELLFRKQLQAYYKFSKSGQMEWLLGAKNFNQILVRNRYFKSISSSFQRTMRRLKVKQQELRSVEVRRSEELQKKKKLATQKRREQEALTKSRGERKKKIDKIVRDAGLLQQSLAEKKASYEKLQKMIQRLRSSRSESRTASVEFDQALWERTRGNFSEFRKKLEWPAKGKILHRFGKYRNPRLKTTLINNGLDIQAPKGAEIKCVFPGVVSLVVYMGGFGNTVIVDHGKEYYTVYAHMEDVFVKKFQIVPAGQTIGTVGDSGSLEGALLHFEIYQNDKPVDPLLWLK